MSKSTRTDVDSGGSCVGGILAALLALALWVMSFGSLHLMPDGQPLGHVRAALLLLVCGVIGLVVAQVVKKIGRSRNERART